MLEHPWLSMPKNYNAKMSEEEFQSYVEHSVHLREFVEDPFAGEEMSKLEETPWELNAADLEDNNRSFYSDLEDDANNPYLSDHEEDL